MANTTQLVSGRVMLAPDAVWVSLAGQGPLGPGLVAGRVGAWALLALGGCSARAGQGAGGLGAARAPPTGTGAEPIPAVALRGSADDSLSSCGPDKHLIVLTSAWGLLAAAEVLLWAVRADETCRARQRDREGRAAGRGGGELNLPACGRLWGLPRCLLSPAIPRIAQPPPRRLPRCSPVRGLGRGLRDVFLGSHEPAPRCAPQASRGEDFRPRAGQAGRMESDAVTDGHVPWSRTSQCSLREPHRNGPHFTERTIEAQPGPVIRGTSPSCAEWGFGPDCQHTLCPVAREGIFPSGPFP